MPRRRPTYHPTRLCSQCGRQWIKTARGFWACPLGHSALHPPGPADDVPLFADDARCAAAHPEDNDLFPED
jgi:hypothetical protein